MSTIKPCALALLAAVALSGCGIIDRKVARYAGVARNCVDGVTYLQFASGATVQVDRTGKPVPCGGVDG